MTKKGLHVVFVILLSCILMLTACSGNNGTSNTTGDTAANNTSSDTKTNTDNATEDVTAESGMAWMNDVSGDVTIWGFNENVFQEIAEAFMQEYPNIHVNAVFVPFGELHDNLQTALASGTGAPDIAEVEVNQFTRYVTGGVLEDLLQEPYNVAQYRDYISDYNWERWRSPDGKQVLGMTWDSTPGVYYYRADIFEELGLPSEPAELGEYIRDGENFLNLVQILAANGKYAMEWRDGPIHWAGDSIGYFDDNLEWVRNQPDLVQILDYTKRGNQLGWAPHMGFGSDEGKQLVKGGQLVGIALGSWGGREIAINFPELSGKWRVTNLPMGINTAIGGSSFVIPSQSKNKEAAWAFMTWCMRSENAWKIWTKYQIQPGYTDIASADWYANTANEFLGGQLEYQVYEELAKHIPAKRLNPLDGLGWGVWLNRVLEALDKNIDSKTTLQLAEDDAYAQLQADIDNLKAELNQ